LKFGRQEDAAREILQGVADGGAEFFNDLYPFQIQVNESMLVKVKLTSA